jgi:hypothetical protein
MAELAFEYLLAGLEVDGALGTPIDPPTRYLNMAGTVTPQRGIYRPPESRGALAEYYRSRAVRQWSAFEAEGGLDVYVLPMLLNAVVKGGVPGTGSEAATVQIDPDGEDNALEWTALDDGTEGNLISIEYVNPDANNSPLDLDLVGNTILVHLQTGVAGAIETVANDIITELALHPTMSLLVSCANVDPDDGTGLVTAMPQTFLAGGESDYVTTPADAVLTRLWTFEPTMDSDDLQALTLYWGDPNVQAFQAAYCQIDSLTFGGDASGEDGVTMAASGLGKFPSKTGPDSVPAMLDAPLMAPGDMQVWIDSGVDAIGDTPIEGRVVSAEVTIPSGIVRKWLAAGPASDLGFTRHGRGRRHIEARLVLELEDMDQYDLIVAHESLKTRLRWNGPEIETEGGTTFYHYCEVDIYGPADTMEWGENQGTNRTIQMTILSEYDADAGYDFAVKVQSDRDTL